jgi:hypothetical protein
MTSKIRIKMGSIEVDYEGPEQFLTKELLKLLKDVANLQHENGNNKKGHNSESENDKDDNEEGDTNAKISGTTKTIAAKLECKNPTDLLMAAAAQLSIVQKKHRFTRKELHDGMKSASGYYKSSMGNNLTKTITGCIKSGELVEHSTDNYALKASKLKELETKLAS